MVLDSNRKFYSFERKERLRLISHATSRIYDENGDLIGKLEGKGTIRKNVTLIDSFGKSLLTVQKGNYLSTQYDYIVIDSTQNELGYVKIEKFPDYHAHMLDKNNKKILIGQGPFKGDVYGIGDENKKIIATFSFSQGKGWKERLSWKEWCNLEIKNTGFDRLMLLGFFVSTYSRFYDITSKGENAT